MSKYPKDTNLKVRNQNINNWRNNPALYGRTGRRIISGIHSKFLTKRCERHRPIWSLMDMSNTSPEHCLRWQRLFQSG